MAIYHLSARVISRSAGRSSVAAAAYRSGEKLTNARDGVTHDYSRKRGIYYTEIMTPAQAPAWLQGREALWNAVEVAEKRINSQTARDFDMALPRELTPEQQKALLRGFVQEQFVEKGMIADLAMHDVSSGNPHAHVMVTMREVDQGGFTVKNRDWNQVTQLEAWREAWASHCNQALENAGSAERVDHRSFETRGLDQQPGVHQGVAGAADHRLRDMSRVGQAQRRAAFGNAFSRALASGKERDGRAREIDDFSARYYYHRKHFRQGPTVHRGGIPGEPGQQPGYRAYELMREEEGYLKFITRDGSDVYGMSYTYVQGFHLARRWKKGKPHTPEHCREILYIHAAIGTFAAHGRNLAVLQQKLDARQLGSLRELDKERDTLPAEGEPVITHFSLPGQDDSDDE